MTDSPGCSDFGAEPVDLFQLVRRCCDCFEGDPAEPDSAFPSWFFSASEWLCPELAELMAIFVSLYQNDPLGFGQKVCSAVGFWIHHHPVHFDANVQLGRLLERLKKLAAADETISKALVDELLDISAIPSYAWLRNVSVRNPISRHVSLCFEQWSPEDIATSMSHIDHKVLSRVQVSELKRYVRVGRLCQTPLLERSIGIFNSFSGWVQCQVLSKSTPSERAEVITKFVQVGRHLRRNNTFNTLMAVIGGITHSNVARLLHTHSLLPPDIVDDLSALTKLLSHANNYAVYRKTLREVGSRFKIPIMGVHLKDLIAFWHSAGLDQFENSRRMSEKFLFDIAYDERELYELSLEREPKAAPTAGATRGFSAEKPSQMATSAAEPPAVFADWAAGVCAQPRPRHYTLSQWSTRYISRAEFEQFASNFPFLDAFGEIDADRDGFISRAEMCTHFQQLNRRKCPGAGEANGSSMLVAGLRRNGLMHKWLDAQFLAPALCAHCNKLLWMRHGVRCKMCACSLHEQCKAEAALKCTHRKRTPNSSASGSSSARSASESGGLMSSWLGASLSPRFTAIGPTPKKASAATADHQKELQMTNGHYRHAKRRGVSGDPRRHPRTSSASSASECSSHNSGGNAALLGAPEGSPPPTSPSGSSYFFIGSSLRSSFHRLMRRTPAESICERSEKQSGDPDNSDRTSRFDSTGDTSSSTSRTRRRRTTTVGGLECADADPPTPVLTGGTVITRVHQVWPAKKCSRSDDWHND
uniref:EF-hand domain-containing protein n=1 Tax=Globodera pallida TaxID=36090 RepID=A0A183CK94_GLOPA